jgi:hypothetical protein
MRKLHTVKELWSDLVTPLVLVAFPVLMPDLCWSKIHQEIYILYTSSRVTEVLDI